MSVETLISTILATAFALIIPWLLAWVVDAGVTSGQFGTLMLAAAAVLVASGLRGLFAYWQGYLSQAVSVLVAYDLRQRIYNHLQRLSFSFHDEAETGQLMSRLTADIEGVRNSLPLGYLRAVIAVLTFGAVSIILAVLDWQLALVTMLSVPILMVLGWQVARRLRPLWVATQSETGKLGTVMQESLSGRRVVLSFVREAYRDRQVREQESRSARSENRDAAPLGLEPAVDGVGAEPRHHPGSLGWGYRGYHHSLSLRTLVRSFSMRCCWARRYAPLAL